MELDLNLDFALAQREEADARMKEYLARIVEGFLRGYPSENVRSLLLTGAMTRGEGSCELRSGKVFIYSDYDFLIVLNRNADIREARQLFPLLSREITDSLKGEEFCSHVDFSPVPSEYFTYMSPSMFNVEVTRHGKAVWGDTSILSEAQGPEASEIPVADALVLLFNRIAAHLLMVDSLSMPEESSDFRFAFYHNGKIFLDLVSCILVLRHDYRSTYAERLSAASRVRGYSGLPSDFVDQASFWTAYKLEPSTQKVCERFSSGQSDTVSGVALRIWNGLIPRMESTLRLFLRELTGRGDASVREGLLAYARRKNMLRRLLEHRSLLHDRARVEEGEVRGLPSFLRGAPLDRTYAAVALLLFSVEKKEFGSLALRSGDYVEDAASILPVTVSRPTELERYWDELRRAATALWRYFVKGGGY